jgi:hypothetical protein
MPDLYANIRQADAAVTARDIVLLHTAIVKVWRPRNRQPLRCECPTATPFGLTKRVTVRKEAILIAFSPTALANTNLPMPTLERA